MSPPRLLSSDSLCSGLLTHPKQSYLQRDTLATGALKMEKPQPATLPPQGTWRAHILPACTALTLLHKNPYCTFTPLWPGQPWKPCVPFTPGGPRSPCKENKGILQTGIPVCLLTLSQRIAFSTKKASLYSGYMYQHPQSSSS